VTAPGGQTNSGNGGIGGVTVQAPSTKAPAKHKKKGKLKVLAKRLRSKSGFTG
jgi:hypothetical protein